jgi:hypothetical protein
MGSVKCDEWINGQNSAPEVKRALLNPTGMWA